MDITLLEVSPQATIIIMLMVAAVVKLVDSGFDRDFRSVAKILGAALLGALCAFGIDGLTVLVGAATGLAVSGLITVVGFVKKTTPVEIVEPQG
jgi:hypothetical protein